MQNSNLETRFITHLIVDKTPEKGFQKLYFYTSTAEGYNKGEYFWGTDNNSLDEDYIKRLENLNQIIRLPWPKEVQKNKSLWVDENGRVYYSTINALFQEISPDKECIFSPQQLSRAYQIYQESIASKGLPKLTYYYEIQ